LRKGESLEAISSSIKVPQMNENCGLFVCSLNLMWFQVSSPDTQSVVPAKQSVRKRPEIVIPAKAGIPWMCRRVPALCGLFCSLNQFKVSKKYLKNLPRKFEKKKK